MMLKINDSQDINYQYEVVSDIMLSVEMLYCLTAVLLDVIMLSIVMLNVSILNVIKLSIKFEIIVK